MNFIEVCSAHLSLSPQAIKFTDYQGRIEYPWNLELMVRIWASLRLESSTFLIFYSISSLFEGKLCLFVACLPLVELMIYYAPGFTYTTSHYYIIIFIHSTLITLFIFAESKWRLSLISCVLLFVQGAQNKQTPCLKCQIQCLTRGVKFASVKTVKSTAAVCTWQAGRSIYIFDWIAALTRRFYHCDHV